ncbi:hypothetical protein HJG60_009576 [Phyllostomus discolor]|uniref:DDE-1 domain-containing protein n=1 Tax=Phyllostomus discolor TaxID=89673 RepID=A0A833Y872_9CHIR|nr:hypothetical protein HJG60_009576 [Phyllostomus discolor]
MENDCLENRIPFKNLLVVDSAPRHHPFIGDLHPNIKVLLLFPNTTSLTQSADQGVSAGLRARSLRSTFALAVPATKEDAEDTRLQSWKGRSVCDCIWDVAWAWDDVPKECVRCVWKKTLKRFVYDFGGFAKDAEVANTFKAMVQLAGTFPLRVDVGDTEEP